MASNTPDSFLRSSAAWLGVEQSRRSDWIYVLSDPEKTELDSAIRAYRQPRKALREIVPAMARWLSSSRAISLVSPSLIESGKFSPPWPHPNGFWLGN
jgi:hypothetical protein